ncbi:MAG: formimidoylglutamase [Leadbetterella sp.]|nr:formimidoylglutamase [Leadbetterella sp.]
MDREESVTGHFIKISPEYLQEWVKSRAGETRLGEVIALSPTPHTRYEIIGIPESVGVRANQGIGGTETAWPAFLKAFLNLQANRFLSGENTCLSGYFQFPDFPHSGIEELRKKVEQIDTEVSRKIYEIVSAGRIPVVIGGGHNNAYGNLKGASQALGMPVSAINLDAHADFRKPEGRHSGNGFSYAMSEGYLGQYSVFGLQKNYVPEYMLREFDTLPQIQVQYLDELLSSNDFSQAVQSALQHTASLPLGIEIDLDALENVLASASSPVGFTVQQALRFIREVKPAPNLTYIHLCEGAQELYDGRTSPSTGKLLAEMVAEFIRNAAG